MRKKLGYNGYKQLAPDKTVHFKPASFDTIELQRYKARERKTPPAKLNGGGSINDYTFRRLAKDVEENPNLLLSGFVDGRLMYIFELPFNTSKLVERLHSQLMKRFPGGKDLSSEYLRGASFNFQHYSDSEELQLPYLAEMNVIKECTYAFNRQFYKFLTYPHSGGINQ